MSLLDDKLLYVQGRQGRNGGVPSRLIVRVYDNLQVIQGMEGREIGRELESNTGLSQPNLS